MSFGPVTSVLKRIECGIFAGTRPQFDDRPSFGTLAFRSRLEYRRIDFSRLISDNFSAQCRNLVIFGSVIPEFKKEEIVQPASNISIFYLGYFRYDR